MPWPRFIIKMTRIMAEIKKGSYERCIQVGHVLEREQFICDGALEDEFQGIKPKKKSKNCRIKDNAILALVSVDMMLMN